MHKLFLGLCVLFAASGSIRAAQFNSLIDFGDSLSDVGNDLSITFGNAPAAPGWYMGRFSNGPIWIDQLAKRLSLPAPVPSTTNGGNDYAYGGVTTGTGSTVLNPGGFIAIRAPNIETQVNTWTGANVANNTQLFTVLGGGNDFFAVLAGTSNVTAQSVADNIRDSIQTLYNDKARNILVGNLPDLGMTPAYLKTAQQAAATKLATDFNTDLSNDLTALLKNDPGLNLYQLDLFGLFNKVIANPPGYGLNDVTDAAYINDPTFNGKGKVVAADPSKYLFWDSVHPTTAAGTIIGNTAAGLVPEPQGLALLLAAGALLKRYRRSH